MQYHPCEAGRSYATAARIYRRYLNTDWNPWHPVRSAKDFELGWWMLRSGLTKGSIDDDLQRGLDDERCISFQTADELCYLFEPVEHSLGPEAGHRSHVGPEHYTLAKSCTVSGYFLAIYLSQTIWSSVPSTSSIVLPKSI